MFDAVDGLEAEHVLLGGAVLERARAAGALGDVAADCRLPQRRGIGRVEQADPFHRVLQVAGDHIGFDDREEVQAVREKSDPIEACKRELETLGVGEAEFKAIDAEIKKRVVESADFAEQSPEPRAEELYTDVLVGSY